jgi:hypothetical protein
MMNEPPESKVSDDICPICNKPKSKHTPNQVLECSKKMREFQDAKEDKSEK